MVDAVRKLGTECTSEFDVAYVGQGAAQHWLFFLERAFYGSSCRALSREAEWVKKVTAHLSSKEDMKPQCVMRN